MSVPANTHWNRLLARPAVVLAAALLAGLIVGHPWPALAIAAIGLLVWQQLRLRRLVQRVASRQRIALDGGHDAWADLGQLLHRSQ